MVSRFRLACDHVAGVKVVRYLLFCIVVLGIEGGFDTCLYSIHTC